MLKAQTGEQNWKQDLQGYLPARIWDLLESVSGDLPLNELRIRALRPLELCFSGYDRLIERRNGPAVTEEDCKELLSRLCQQSVYAWEEELNAGFLTLPGGYRVGVCGRVGTGGRGLPEAVSFNIRIARSVPTAAGRLMKSILDPEGRLINTLVVSPPGCGKTTLLRDLARRCSWGIDGAKPSRVGIVDTRYELAGCSRGVPQLDVGPRTDVLSGMEKSLAMSRMVTTMSPEVLITDEIGTLGDAEAVLDAIRCGVFVAASAHAARAAELMMRKPLSTLLMGRAFGRIVLLGKSRGMGTVEGVFDDTFHPIAMEEEPCCEWLLS